MKASSKKRLQKLEETLKAKPEILRYPKRYPKFNIVNTVTMPGPSWTGLTGRITADMIKNHMPDYLNRVFYISGPTRMVDSMLILLKEIDIPEEQIKKEFFTGYD